MYFLVFIALLEYVVIFGKASMDIEGSKVWSIYKDGSFECGSKIRDAVFCDDNYIWIQSCYCMFFIEDQNSTVLGNCMTTCYYVRFHEVGRAYYKLDRYAVVNGSQLNEAICSTSIAHIDTNVFVVDVRRGMVLLCTHITAYRAMTTATGTGCFISL